MGACRDEFTVVLLELNGNPGQTFQLKRDLEQLLPQALREHICKHVTLPDSWNRKYLRESDLLFSIGDAAISDEMSLHQNGVTDGTVITVTVLNTSPDRWQQIEEKAERFFKLGRAGGGAADGQQYTPEQCCIKALELDDQNTNAWLLLGNTGGGSVDGQQYTGQQCYIKALEMDDHHALAWNLLGYHGGGSVGGQQYTKQQCHQKYNEVRAVA